MLATQAGLLKTVFFFFFFFLGLFFSQVVELMQCGADAGVKNEKGKRAIDLTTDTFITAALRSKHSVPQNIPFRAQGHFGKNPFGDSNGSGNSSGNGSSSGNGGGNGGGNGSSGNSGLVGRNPFDDEEPDPVPPMDSGRDKFH